MTNPSRWRSRAEMTAAMTEPTEPAPLPADRASDAAPEGGDAHPTATADDLAGRLRRLTDQIDAHLADRVRRPR